MQRTSALSAVRQLEPRVRVCAKLLQWIQGYDRVQGDGWPYRRTAGASLHAVQRFEQPAYAARPPAASAHAAAACARANSPANSTAADTATATAKFTAASAAANYVRSADANRSITAGRALSIASAVVFNSTSFARSACCSDVAQLNKAEEPFTESAAVLSGTHQ